MSDSGAKEMTVSITTVRWAVGIIIGLVIFSVGVFRTSNSDANARASDLEVLKVRVTSLESTLARVTSSTQQIATSVSNLGASQSAFQARVQAEFEALKKITEDLKSYDLERRRRNRSGSP
jgi:uncharacterized protein YlxW (UPF0749 family)